MQSNCSVKSIVFSEQQTAICPSTTRGHVFDAGCDLVRLKTSGDGSGGYRRSCVEHMRPVQHSRWKSSQRRAIAMRLRPNPTLLEDASLGS